jgi:hypothetical protein
LATAADSALRPFLTRFDQLEEFELRVTIDGQRILLPAHTDSDDR